MVRKEETSKGDNSNISECTTESSDSYSYLLRDVENPNNHINEEWEAIERTLYQESGQHVTDPALLKECKLWRETFPHIRVRGKAIRVGQDEDVAVSKSVQAIDKNHIALSKLNEKREKIKKTVVSQIVERLINKLNINKENPLDNKKIMELDGEENVKPNVNTKSYGTQAEKESYFERGKKVDTREKITKFPAEERQPPVSTFWSTDDVSENSDDFERGSSTEYFKTGNNKPNLWSGYCHNDKPVRGKEYTSNLSKNAEILRSSNITFKIAKKNPSTCAKRENASDSISAAIKSFEMTKKIDKKYEAMLERILENKGYSGIDSKSPKREKSSPGEPIENPYGKHKRGDFSHRRNKQLPKLNNFTNNWLNRAEQPSPEPYCNLPRNLYPVSQTYFTREKHSNSSQLAQRYSSDKHSNFQSCRSANQSDQNFIEEIRGEMGDYPASLRRDFEEVINFRRPQFHNKYKKNFTARTQKSSSCSDLPKKTPKSCNRTLKSGLEKGKSELTVRNGNKKKTAEHNGNQNIQLPPIETSIICTEIVGRPKITSRTLPKKYI